MKSFAFLPILLLAGCAALPPQPVAEPPSYLPHLQKIQAIRHFEVVGRIAILTETKGFSGTMRWYHREEGDEIAFYSPVGSQLGQLHINEDKVVLTTGNHETFEARDAATLTQKTLGWSLPLEGLSDWVLGRPSAADEAEILSWDEAGHIARMRQSGWDIEYPGYREADGCQLPAKIVMRSSKLDLKLVIENWQTDAQ